MKPGVLGDSGSKPWLFFGLFFEPEEISGIFRAGFRTARAVRKVPTWIYWGSSRGNIGDHHRLQLWIINELMNQQSILIYFTTNKLGSIQCSNVSLWTSILFGDDQKTVTNQSPTLVSNGIASVSIPWPPESRVATTDTTGLEASKNFETTDGNQKIMAFGTVSLEALIYVY